MRLIGSALIGLVALGSAGVAIGQSGGGGQQATTKSGDPLICRRIQETGSLGRGRRVCYTRSEWDRIATAQRENSPGMTAQSGSTSGN
jgi:carbamoylphosphate synthase large subunit